MVSFIWRLEGRPNWGAAHDCNPASGRLLRLVGRARLKGELPTPDTGGVKPDELPSTIPYRPLENRRLYAFMGRRGNRLAERKRRRHEQQRVLVFRSIHSGINKWLAIGKAQRAPDHPARRATDIVVKVFGAFKIEGIENMVV